MSNYTFNSITKETLQALIDNKAVEDQQLEFKRYNFANGKVPDRERNDLLKEITSLANANGGLIIIGIDEEKGVASRLMDVGCSISDFDDIQLAIQQAILAKVRPRIYDIKMKAIEVIDDKITIIISVPKSFNRPHAVNDGNKDNFYVRHSNGATHMSVDDLRKQFIFSSSFKFEIKNFRQERIGLILGNECIGNLAEGAKVLLHVIPLWSLETGNNIDVKQLQHTYFDKAIPISGGNWYQRYNSDGYCIYGRDYQTNNINTYTQTFRNGIIEAVDIRMMNYNRQFTGQTYDWRITERSVYNAIQRYSDLLQQFNIPKPWYIFISFLNAKGFRTDNFYSGTSETIDRDIIHATEGVWNDDNQILSNVLKPTLDSLANAFGMSQSPSYDRQGNYIEKD